jgi:hypothetical protein
MMDSTWKTSSYTQGGNSNCVEARLATADTVNIRDTHYPERGHLEVPGSEWRALLGALRLGELA